MVWLLQSLLVWYDQELIVATLRYQLKLNNVNKVVLLLHYAWI